jgi:hypothetical protein
MPVVNSPRMGVCGYGGSDTVDCGRQYRVSTEKRYLLRFSVAIQSMIGMRTTMAHQMTVEPGSMI